MTFIHQVPGRHDVRRAYDRWSSVYDLVAAPWEFGARMQALRAVRHSDGCRVLDVGIGPGAHFARVVDAAPASAIVCGIDLSSRMVHKAQRRLRSRAMRGAVIEADALTLPFAGESFDTVLSSYLLDLLPMEAIAGVLSEFLRVLRPAGRVVLVNLTKLDLRTTFYERCYRALPPLGQAYLLGGCRPVRLAHMVKAAGFVSPQRDVVKHALPSEIIVARKPSAT